MKTVKTMRTNIVLGEVFLRPTDHHLYFALYADWDSRREVRSVGAAVAAPTLLGTGPGPKGESRVGVSHWYWIASRIRVPAARRAGSTAATTPTTTARARNTPSCSHGRLNTRLPSPICVTIT